MDTKTEDKVYLVEYTNKNIHHLAVPKQRVKDPETGKWKQEYNAERRMDVDVLEKWPNIRLLPGINSVPEKYYAHFGGVEGMCEKQNVGDAFKLVAETNDLYAIIRKKKRKDEGRALAIDIIGKTGDITLLNRWRDDDQLTNIAGLRQALDEKIFMLESPVEYMKKYPKGQQRVLAATKYR